MRKLDGAIYTSCTNAIKKYKRTIKDIKERLKDKKKYLYINMSANPAVWDPESFVALPLKAARKWLQDALAGTMQALRMEEGQYNRVKKRMISDPAFVYKDAYSVNRLILAEKIAALINAGLIPEEKAMLKKLKEVELKGDDRSRMTYIRVVIGMKNKKIKTAEMEYC
jgi:hypothetical protein